VNIFGLGIRSGLGKIAGLLTVAAALGLAGCGGGGGGGGGATTTTGPVTTVSGTAAGGAPVIGQVTLKDAVGTVRRATIQPNGAFSISTTGLQAPYILYANGTVNGLSVTYSNVGVTPGNLIRNLTPITDLITANALGGDPYAYSLTWDAYAQQANNSPLANIQADMSNAETNVRNVIQPLLQAAGLTNQGPVDLLGGAFAANHTGMDGLLDTTKVTFTGTNATIVNRALPGIIINNNVTSKGADLANQTLGTPADVAAIQAALQNASAQATLDQFTATVNATLSNPNSTIADTYSWFAPDFLSGYLAGTGITNPMGDAAGYKASIGSSISYSDIYAMTAAELAGTNYTKGYWGISWNTEPNGYPSWPTRDAMVWDGAKWMMWGDRHPVEAVMGFSHHYTAQNRGGGAASPPVSIITIYLSDNSGSAFAGGVRSAVVSGPGLDMYGYVLGFDGLNPVAKDLIGLNGPVLTEAQAASIPPLSEYRMRYCVETMAALTATGNPWANCTKPADPKILVEYIFRPAGQPRLPSTLIAADFPALVTPALPVVGSIVTVGGATPVTWAVPANRMTSQLMVLYTDTAQGQFNFSTWIHKPVTSANLDTTAAPAPAVTGQFIIFTKDLTSGTEFNTGYDF